MRAVFAGVFILCCSCGNRAEAGPIGSFPFESEFNHLDLVFFISSLK